MADKKNPSPIERLYAARAKGRPTAKSYIENIFNNFIELHGDRYFADDSAIIGGIATISGCPVTVIAIEKGIDTKDKIERNFGAPNPEGYRKSLRLMKQAEKFKRPVICFVDTAGAFCGIGAEERGQGRAIADNLMHMMTLKTPVLSILIGEGGSGGALALSVADEVWMLSNSVYSVISPEGCASILWKDPKRVEEACNSLKITAKELKEMGIVEKVFEEDGKSFDNVYNKLKEHIWEFIKLKREQKTEELLVARYERFRSFGSQ